MTADDLLRQLQLADHPDRALVEGSPALVSSTRRAVRSKSFTNSLDDGNQTDCM